MELRQIEALIVLSQEGSFTRAADHLEISQPSLSARIRRLERSLGTSLIDRQSRPVTLTQQGRLFMDYAERAIAILAAAKELLTDQYQSTFGEIKVGCPFSAATYLMPQVVDRFSKSFPQAQLVIETGNSDYVVDQLTDGLINLAVAAAFPKFFPRVEILLRLHDEMTAAVTPSHPFAQEPEVLVSEIWHNRVLLIQWGPAFHMYVENLRNSSSKPGPLVRLPLASALPMAHQPNTVTFMPRRLVAPSGLIEVPVKGFAFSWDIAIMTRHNRSLLPLEQAFVDIIIQTWESSAPT